MFSVGLLTSSTPYVVFVASYLIIALLGTPPQKLSNSSYISENHELVLNNYHLVSDFSAPSQDFHYYDVFFIHYKKLHTNHCSKQKQVVCINVVLPQYDLNYFLFNRPPPVLG